VHLPEKKISRGKYLLSSLKDLTRSTLEFSEQLGNLIVPQQERMLPKRKVIEGVYVPALSHLLHKYSTPSKSDDLAYSARNLLACGGYVEAACIGYPDGFWWDLLNRISIEIKATSTAAQIYVNTSHSIQDCKFVLINEGTRCGFVACDEGNAGAAWLTGALESTRDFRASNNLHKTACVVRRMEGAPPAYLPEDDIPLIVNSDPKAAAQRFMDILVG
jgi:hypothetical protein